MGMTFRFWVLSDRILIYKVFPCLKARAFWCGYMGMAMVIVVGPIPVVLKEYHVKDLALVLFAELVAWVFLWMAL